MEGLKSGRKGDGPPGDRARKAGGSKWAERLRKGASHLGREGILLLAASLLMGGALFFLDRPKPLQTTEEGQAYLLRNDPEEGRRQEELEATSPSLGPRDIQVELEARTYSSEEARQKLEQALAELEGLVLGENPSPEQVSQDLVFPNTLQEGMVEVAWDYSHPELLNPDGSLEAEALTSEGTVVEVTAYLTCQGESLDHTFPLRLYAPDLVQEITPEGIAKALQAQEEESRDQEKLLLPEELGGEDISWSRQGEGRWLFVPAMGVVLALLLALRKREKEKQDHQKRKKQMLLDYPEIVNTLTLYTGAGMPLFRAWERMVREYEGREGSRGIRYAYEEMRRTLHEMQGGESEQICYERFGNRCGQQAFLKLGALLSQNLRKGTKGLSDLLRGEAYQAFEDRKALAKRQGEEAGTKLLIPMFLMLGVVLVIVIVPAFFSMQL